MENRIIPERESIYLDELSFSATWSLFRIKDLKNVTVLESIRHIQKLWCWLLKKKGINIIEASFFAGDLKTEEGEAVRRASLSLAGQIALKAAQQIVNSSSQLNNLNTTYGRNTLQLFIAKKLHLHIGYWTFRVFVARALCTGKRMEVWLKEPTRFEGRLIGEAISGIDLRFYSTFIPLWITLAIFWIYDFAQDIKLNFGLQRHKKLSEPLKNGKASVLMLQENTIRADHSLRGQPHWITFSNQNDSFNTYLVEIKGPQFAITEDAAKLSKAAVTILSTSDFRFALHAMRNDKILVRVRHDRRLAIRAIFGEQGFANKFFLLRTASLLRQAELMGALALWLNARLFLISETYHPLADAMQMVAPELNVKTLAYQYSNMGSVSPTMMSTADKFLIFSDMFKAIYQTDSIGPQEFLPTGYLFDGISSLVRKKANKHRYDLNSKGAKFIVCYFDESVQHDRWGLVSKGHHLDELHCLAKTVLIDPTFGLVVKSQFINNSPSQSYPDDKIIQAAKATGRYLELMEGVHRNDIYPTEAALAADLCIGHKFGATAALEAAIAGVRTVLLDPYGIKTLWDEVYAKAAIEYKSMDLLMVAIKLYRAGSTTEQNIGDWTPILQYFDPYRDGKAVDRLRHEISSFFLKIVDDAI